MENLEIKQENTQIEEVKLEEIPTKTEDTSLVKDFFVKDNGSSKKELASLFGQSEYELQKEFGSYKAKKIYKRLNMFIDGNSALKEEIISKLDLASKYAFYGVTVFPLHLPLAKNRLKNSGVKVRVLIGYPYGLDGYKCIKYSLKQTIDRGADEIVLSIPSYLIKNGEIKEPIRCVKKLKKYLRKKPLTLSLDATYLTIAEIENAVNQFSALTISGINLLVNSGVDKNLIESVVNAVCSRAQIEYFSNVCSAEDAVSVLLSGVNLLTTHACEQVVSDLNKKINTTSCDKPETLDNNP